MTSIDPDSKSLLPRIEELDKQLGFTFGLIEQILEHIPIVVWMASPDLKYLYYVSPAFDRMWCIPAAKVLGRNSDIWLGCVARKDRERIKKELDEHRRAGTAHSMTQRFQLSSGIRVEVKSYPITDASGNIVRSVGVTREIERI